MRHLTEGIVLSWAGKSVLETSWGNSLDFATWRRKGKRKGWEGKGKAKGEGGKFGTVPNFWAQMNLVHIACDWCRSWSADVNYAVWSARGPTGGAYYGFTDVSRKVTFPERRLPEKNCVSEILLKTKEGFFLNWLIMRLNAGNRPSAPVIHLVLFLNMLILNSMGVLCVCHVIELRMLS